MGNSTVESADTLKFIQTLQDPHFGQIDVFRSQDGRFLMRVKRTHIVGDSRHTFFQRVVEWLHKNASPHIVPITHIHSEVQRGLCIQFQVSEVYSEYFNFTLMNLLEARKELQEGELWFLLQSLLGLVISLRSNKLAMSIKLQRVFLTLKGVPCVYFHHFLPLQESIINSQYSMAQQVAILILQLAANQQLSQVEEEQEHSKTLLSVLGKVCAKFKLLGRLIKELLTRQKTEEEALEEVSALTKSGKIIKFSEIKLNKFRYSIPEQSVQKPKEPDSEKRVNNQPISFKSKKRPQNHKNSFKLHDFSSQSINEELKHKQEELKKKLNDMMPKKEETERLFGELVKRKEECRAKMERLASKKEELLESEKENKQAKQPRKSSQKKGRERRLTQANRCNYR